MAPLSCLFCTSLAYALRITYIVDQYDLDHLIRAIIYILFYPHLLLLAFTAIQQLDCRRRKHDFGFYTQVQVSILRSMDGGLDLLSHQLVAFLHRADSDVYLTLKDYAIGPRHCKKTKLVSGKIQFLGGELVFSLCKIANILNITCST